MLIRTVLEEEVEVHVGAFEDIPKHDPFQLRSQFLGSGPPKPNQVHRLQLFLLLLGRTCLIRLQDASWRLGE